MPEYIFFFHFASEMMLINCFVLAEEINQQNKCNSMSDAKRVCLDLCTLECGLILETERDSATESVSKAVDLRKIKHIEKLKTESFF